MIGAIRCSKTGFKQWVMFGDDKDALMTSCQAADVGCLPLRVNVHGTDVALEMWHNLEEADPSVDETNPNAQTILQFAKTRSEYGMTPPEALLAGKELPALPIIQGVTILTGPGRTNFPEDQPMMCVLATLMGMHPEHVEHSS